MNYYNSLCRLIVVFFLLLMLQRSTLAQIKDEVKLDSTKTLLMDERYDESINLLNSILIEDSSNVNAYNYLNICYRAKSKYQKSADVLTKALKYKPADIKIMISLGNDLIVLGRLSEAKEILLKAYAFDSTNALILNALGKVHVQKHNWAEASKIYNELIKFDSSNSYYFEQLGKCYSKRDDKDNAIVCFQIAHRLNPMNEQTIMDLSQLYLLKGQLISAMRIIDNGLAFYQNSTYMWSMKGKLYLGMQEFSDAIISCKNSVRLGDSSLINFRTIGVCNYYLGDYDSSIIYLNTANKINKDDPTSHFYLGTSYKELNKFSAAIENLSISADLLKDDFTAEVYTQLGAAYYSIKNYREALNYYKYALREKPDKLILNFYLAVVFDEYYKDKSVAMNYYKKFLADSAKTDGKLVSYAKERLTSLTEDDFMKNKR